MISSSRKDFCSVGVIVSMLFTRWHYMWSQAYVPFKRESGSVLFFKVCLICDGLKSRNENKMYQMLTESFDQKLDSTFYTLIS